MLMHKSKEFNQSGREKKYEKQLQRVNHGEVISLYGRT